MSVSCHNILQVGAPLLRRSSIQSRGGNSVQVQHLSDHQGDHWYHIQIRPASLHPKKATWCSPQNNDKACRWFTRPWPFTSQDKKDDGTYFATLNVKNRTRTSRECRQRRYFVKQELKLWQFNTSSGILRYLNVYALSFQRPVHRALNINWMNVFFFIKVKM